MSPHTSFLLVITLIKCRKHVIVGKDSSARGIMVMAWVGVPTLVIMPERKFPVYDLIHQIGGPFGGWKHN